MITIDGPFTTGVLQQLVRINSVNPSLDPAGAGEADIARYTASTLTELGLDVRTHEPEPGRVSVVGRLRGTGGGRTLMLNAHHDTVAVDEMVDPFSGSIRDGKCYGRGSYDMKGSLAACIGAAKALIDTGVSLPGDVLVAAVADEEFASMGTSDLIGRYRVDGAIVTEPTSERICLAHKGFTWASVTVHGRAAHGSQFTVGIDANVRLGALLVEIGRLATELTSRPPHRLVGPPSIHASMVRGGTGMSTYAASATVQIERRTVPGETREQVAGELQQLIDRLAAKDTTFDASLAMELVREPFEVSEASPLVKTLTTAATRVLDTTPVYVGENPWMDSALLAASGVDTVVFGPHGAGAHASEEWVDVRSVNRVAQVLAETAGAYCA
jgi:acetylornithine deacetylase